MTMPSTPPPTDLTSTTASTDPHRTNPRSDTMQPHQPDRAALVFGVLFTTVGAAALARIADIAHVDSAVALGVGLVVTAVLIVALTITPARAGLEAHATQPDPDPDDATPLSTQ